LPCCGQGPPIRVGGAQDEQALILHTPTASTQTELVS
jgi:hypothetical protein